MDVLQRLIPRQNGGVQFKRLKHSSNTMCPNSDNNNFGLTMATDVSADHVDQDNLALIPASNSRVELGLVINSGKKQKKGNSSPRNSLDTSNDSPRPIVQNGKENGLPPPKDNVLASKRSTGRRLMGTLLPGRRKATLSPPRTITASASEPQLLNKFEMGGGVTEHAAEDNNVPGQKKSNSRHRLYESCGRTATERETTTAVGRRTTVAGALQKVREKLPSRRGPSSVAVSSPPPTKPSATLHRSNTASNALSDAGVESQELDEKIQNASTLGKLRKQAKIMDIVGRKAGNGSGSRKSDVQRLLLFEEGYSSGME